MIIVLIDEDYIEFVIVEMLDEVEAGKATAEYHDSFFRSHKYK